MDARDQSSDCAPLAALLYDSGTVPGIGELLGATRNGAQFSVTHAVAPDAGWAEVLRDGLTFDLRGLAGGDALGAPVAEHVMGLDPGRITELSALLLFPGPHLAGAERLLPVIRVASALLLDLARIGASQAVCWIPAKNALSPQLFSRAVTPWLEGGPFPALALAGLHRDADGSIVSNGLKFLIGQEFYLVSESSSGPDHLTRVAVRLIDWLVAYGPVTKPVEAVLAGTGAVFLEAQDGDRIVARCA